MAVDTYALTSLVNLKAYLGVTTTTDDSLMESIINRASARIESFLDRKILSRTYTEWRTAERGKAMRVRNRPIISVQSVLTGSQNAISVSSATSTDVASSVSVSADSSLPAIILRRTSSAGTTTSTSLDFATYPTISGIVAAMTATSGFTATAQVTGRSAHLRPFAGVSLMQTTAYLSSVYTTIDCTADIPSGVLTLDHSRWLNRPAELLIEYTAGYATIPYDIEQSAIEVAAQIFHGRKRDESNRSESLGDYSFTMASSIELAAIISERLNARKSIR